MSVALDVSSRVVCDSYPSQLRERESQERTLRKAKKNDPPGQSSQRVFCPPTVADELPTVRRSRVLAVMAAAAAVPTRILALCRVLLPRRDVRVELLLLIRCEDRSHRRELTLALLLHLRAQRLHLGAGAGGVALLTHFAGILHRLAELVIGLLALAQLLQARLLGVGEVDVLEELTARSPHAALALLLTLWLLGRLRRKSADGTEGQRETKSHGRRGLSHRYISVSCDLRRVAHRCASVDFGE